MQGNNREDAVRAIYQQLLNCWNQRSASEFAALFTEDGFVIGFDGSIHSRKEGITADLSEIFTHHETPVYVGLIKNVRILTNDTAVLLAVAGMVPRGDVDINPNLNAIQSLLAIYAEAKWQIAAFQNTPAAFHGRADLREQLTQELRRQLPGPSAFA